MMIRTITTGVLIGMATIAVVFAVADPGALVAQMTTTLIGRVAPGVAASLAVVVL